MYGVKLNGYENNERRMVKLYGGAAVVKAATGTLSALETAAAKAAADAAAATGRATATAAARQAAMASATAAIAAGANAEAKAAIRLALKANLDAAGNAAIKAANESVAATARSDALADAVKVAKQIDTDAAAEAAKLAKGGAKETSQSALSKMSSWVGRHKTATFLGVTATVVGGIALSKFAAANGMELDIIKIEPYDQSLLSAILQGSNSFAKITYSKQQLISTNDTVTIADSDSVPAIDGHWPIVDSDQSGTSIIVQIPALITTNGTKGTMTLHTTFLSQLASTLREPADDLANEAKDFLTDNPLNPFSNMSNIIIAVVSVVLCIVFSMLLLKFSTR